MNAPTRQGAANQEAVYLALAREIAMDMVPVEDILKHYEISRDTFEDLLRTTHFQSILAEQVRNWSAAPNTGERLKYKHQGMLEEALPEMFGRLHDRNEPLSAKVELFKALQRGAGMLNTDDGGSAGKVSITINMGEAGNVTAVTQKVTSPIDYDGALDV
jgi:hypothetical protein